MKLLSLVQLCATPRTIAYHTPLSIGFSRQEYWSRLPFPSPEDLPDPGIEPGSLALQAYSLLYFSVNMTLRTCGLVVWGLIRGRRQSSIFSVKFAVEGI